MADKELRERMLVLAMEKYNDHATALVAAQEMIEFVENGNKKVDFGDYNSDESLCGNDRPDCNGSAETCICGSQI